MEREVLLLLFSGGGVIIVSAENLPQIMFINAGELLDFGRIKIWVLSGCVEPIVLITNHRDVELLTRELADPNRTRIYHWQAH